MRKLYYYTRDLILFIILLLLVQRFIMNTLPLKTPSSCTIHSLHESNLHDARFLNNIKKNKETIRQLVHNDPTPLEQEFLLDLYVQLSSIEKEYTYISPGLALLGPFSSMYLEIKQQTLREKTHMISEHIKKIMS